MNYDDKVSLGVWVQLSGAISLNNYRTFKVLW